MKTNKILVIFACLTISLQAFSQLTYTNNGMLGIRRTPSFNLDVEGTTRFSGWTDVTLTWGTEWSVPQLVPENNWYLFLGSASNWVGHIWVYDINYRNMYKSSDYRSKENIDTLTSVLYKLKQINSYKYNFKDDFIKDLPEKVKSNYKKTEYGFIAQELDKVFPELIHKSDTGMLSVDYISMIPILTEAINEQQNQISTLQSIVYSQEKEIIKLKNEVEKLLKNDAKLKSNPAILDNSTGNEQNTNLLMQNSPNPFTIDTEIRFFISDEISNARLIIHDMQGVEILSYTIQERGNGNKIVRASELKAGMYLYTLITDGKIIDSKRMILTSE